MSVNYHINNVQEGRFNVFSVRLSLAVPFNLNMSSKFRFFKWQVWFRMSMSGCTVHKVDLTAATWCVRAGAALKMLSDLPLTRDLHSSFMLLSQFLPSPQVLHLCSSKHAACSRLLSFSKGSILPSLFMKKNFYNLFVSIIQAWILLSLTISYPDLYSSWILC